MNRAARRFFWPIAAPGLSLAGAAVVAAVFYGPGSSSRLAVRILPAPPARPAGQEPGPPAAVPGRRDPEVWGVVVGVNHYPDGAIPACRGAVRDARAVARWLGTTAGWGDDHVLLLDDFGGSSPGALVPTRENLDRAFRAWLPARVRPGDTVVVYFAGQAAAADVPGRGVLLPSDAKAADPAGTGWRLDEAIDGLAAAGTNPIVCWIDTGLGGRGKPVPGRPAGPDAASDMLRRLVRWPGVTAWLAADGRPAREAERAGDPGAFAAALLRGLGTRGRPRGLYACLSDLGQDAALAAQGFRSLGGVEPDLNLWPAQARRESWSRRELILQRGHAGAVTSLAFTADGARLVSGAHDSTVKVWDPSDRRLLRAMTYHLVGVTALALSPDGRTLASGDGAGRLRLWDLARDRALADAPPHDRGVDRLAFLPDARHVAGLDLGGTAWLRDVTAPETPPRRLAAGVTGLAGAAGRGPVGLVLALRDGTLRTFGPGGEPVGTADGPGGLVAARALATDGRLVAAGDDAGRVVVRDDESGSELLCRSFGDPVAALALSAAGDLAVASGTEVRWFAAGRPPEASAPLKDDPLPLGSPANLVLFAPDGRSLACATREGRVHLWRADEAGRPAAVPLEAADESGETTSLAFAPDGRTLASGDRDGGLRSWALPGGKRLPGVAPRRGQVADLSVSADARFLLQVTRDGRAQVWDLQEGRALQTLEGSWAAGVLSPDGASAFLADLSTGRVASRDRATGRPGPVRFDPVGPKVGLLSLSADGRWLAGGGVEGSAAYVWDTANGRLVQTFRNQEGPARTTALNFSNDARRLLTAADDGTAVVWDWDPTAPDGPSRRAASMFTLTGGSDGEPVPISAARLDPADPRRVALGGIDGRVVLRDPGRAGLARLGDVEGAVSALAFTPDGRWLAASGADKSIQLFRADGSGRRARLGPGVQHAEQVNALIAWPDGRLIASASDDTTVRLWGVEERALLGTLSADQETTDWVAYTPEGLFDASVAGENQLAWLDGREVLSLEQVGDARHAYLLTNDLRRGKRPKAPAPAPVRPPRLSIDPPRVAPDRPEAELTVEAGEEGLTDLRLYHNGVPVQAEGDMTPGPSRRSFTARVTLRRGLNRFYAMAGRRGAPGVEGRSGSADVRYDGPDSPGRLHVVALGVSRYGEPARDLQFADRDARELAAFLRRATPPGGDRPGLTRVLLNDGVTADAVDGAFRELRDAVRSRPQDTVVVFLAGHASADDGRFRLLLAGKADANLPYSAVYRNLIRLGALRRVVVIDACQAGAIADDPGVRMIERMTDGGARRAKTAYLLAARRGEPAGEVAALKHGLLTYALLRGMAAPGLETVPGLPALDDPPDADADRDGVVTTAELRAFTDRATTRLIAAFPVLALRQPGARPPAANLDQRLRIQASDTSFPLIALPRRPAGGG